MKELNFLSTIEAVETKVVTVEEGAIERLKKCLFPHSQSVEITIVESCCMLGFKYVVRNAESYPYKGEIGIDMEGLDAVLAAMCGNMDALKAYNPMEHAVERQDGIKYDLLRQFSKASIVHDFDFVRMPNEKLYFSVSYQLSYSRRVKFFFDAEDTKAEELFKEIGYLVD